MSGKNAENWVQCPHCRQLVHWEKYSNPNAWMLPGEAASPGSRMYEYHDYDPQRLAVETGSLKPVDLMNAKKPSLAVCVMSGVPFEPSAVSKGKQSSKWKEKETQLSLFGDSKQ